MVASLRILRDCQYSLRLALAAGGIPFCDDWGCSEVSLLWEGTSNRRSEGIWRAAHVINSPSQGDAPFSKSMVV